MPLLASSITDVASTLAYLDSLRNAERMTPADAKPLLTLHSMRRLCRAVFGADSPPNLQPAVHIAGSKGKGTVATLIAAGLAATGIRCGLYVSPHILHIRERISINGTEIAEEEFTYVIRQIAEKEESSRNGEQPATQFEVMTAAAFYYFNQQGCGCIVVETGLGGAHDATNVLTPILSVLTAIQLEHTEVLGRSLEDIARAKAGIIKPGAPALMFTQREIVTAVFEERAAACGVPLVTMEKCFRCYTTLCPSDEAPVSMDLVPVSADPEIRFIQPVKGNRAGFNTALAICACNILLHFMMPRRKSHFTDMHDVSNITINARPDLLAYIEYTATLMHPSLHTVVHAIAKTKLIARFDRRIINSSNFDFGEMVTFEAIVDGCHTPDSVSELLLDVVFVYDKDNTDHTVIFACAADKDIHGMLAHIKQWARTVVFTTSARLGVRAADPQDLLAAFQAVQPVGKPREPQRVMSASSLKEALAVFVGHTSPKKIIICGSFSIAADAIELAVT